MVYDLCLAEVARPAGQTSLTTADITDTRADEALCGLMRDGVTGIPVNALGAQALAKAKETAALCDALLQSYTGGYLGIWPVTLTTSGCRIVRLGDSRERKKRPHLVKKLNHKSIKEGIQMKQNRIFDQNSSQKARSWHYNMDTNRAEAQFADGSAIAIDCLAIEDEYGNTPAQRAELDWLLYNKPLECVQLVLSGEIEHYLSLGCDHGKLKD